jgi:hypothetical protein
LGGIQGGWRVKQGWPAKYLVISIGFCASCRFQSRAGRSQPLARARVHLRNLIPINLPNNLDRLPGFDAAESEHV